MMEREKVCCKVWWRVGRECEKRGQNVARKLYGGDNGGEKNGKEKKKRVAGKTNIAYLC